MSVSLTIMTFNLLEDQQEDSPNSWDKRKDLCVTVITSYSPMIICTQQGVKSQLDYLRQCLPVSFDLIGKTESFTCSRIQEPQSRIINKSGEEDENLKKYSELKFSWRSDWKGFEDSSDQHCTIFYDKEKVELLEGGTFWLSESPSVPGSISWGSSDPCISTWAISFTTFISSSCVIFCIVQLIHGLI
ncbi:hypothetical protein ACJIZ3_025243 [Penstemon smallii]|uniref:DNAse I-like superfamily protein n=1 Tax=Penstemon smallii TaxID=265156 RepID=A0ABD3TWP4_9LAMI